MANFYTPSNKFSPLSFLLLILSCFLIIPILSFIYSYAIWYIPFPYINFFITAGFGFLIGLIIQQLVINFGKVRNTALAGVFGAIGGLVGLYFSWTVWISLAMESPEVISSSLSLASSPGTLFAIIAEIQEVGIWGLFDNAVSGIPLMIVWLIEAGIIIVLGVLSPLGKSRDPFCEVNNKWFAEKILPALNYIVTPQDCVVALENNDLEYFKAMEQKANPASESHSAFVLYSNETNENFLTVTNQIASLNDKGETEFEDQDIIRFVEITEELSNLLEAS